MSPDPPGPPAAALLRSNLPLHRHISGQLGHENIGIKDSSSSAVLKFIKKKKGKKIKSPEGGSGKAPGVFNPGQVLAVCAVAGI